MYAYWFNFWQTLYCIVLYCIVLYCIVLYCIMRPYTDGPIGPLSYRHSSGVVRNSHSALADVNDYYIQPEINELT